MKHESFYILHGPMVVLTIEASDEADARVHFGEWVKREGKLDMCYSLAKAIVSVNLVADIAMRRLDGTPKLESLVTEQKQTPHG